MMKFLRRKYDNRAEFLIGDHYVNVMQKVERFNSADGTKPPAEIVQVGDRFIVKQGTLIRVDGIKAGSSEGDAAAALGLAYSDYDITDGDVMMAVCVHGVVRESALPATIAEKDKATLKGIIFV